MTHPEVCDTSGQETYSRIANLTLRPVSEPWRPGLSSTQGDGRMLETYLDLLDMEYFEIGEAFKGLTDENVWKRPADSMLSVGEIAGHICYWEASRLAGGGGNLDEHVATDTDACRVSSPLIDSRFAYYPKTLASSPSEEHLAMTANDVFRELMRVHTESVAIFRESNPDLDSDATGWSSGATGWPEGMTHKDILKYLVFHVAYHTGQIYSVRHLLGEKTVDN
ncbi:MAG: DUF664 domain-containing protein [Fibrella sp.]|nr:DUF664 domain-containing protein [Armatimonadota bacterium]